jgi:hypothetical protein
MAAAYLRTVSAEPDSCDGRGIVTCAGGVKYLTCAWVLINTLRRLGCTLPIEVWYLGDDEGDADWIRLVEPLDVKCVDATEVAKQYPHPRLGGWQAKAFAIRHCRFREVLFLDADNVPVVDPTFLFESPEYLAHGAAFWPDGSRTPENSSAWKIFGVPFRDEREFESGQFTVDKERCWPAVCLADWYNRNSDFFYQYVYGDKDTFRFAWHRNELSFAMPDADVTTIPYTLCQHDFCGGRLFQHRIHDKWSLIGNRRGRDFLWEEECLQDVAKLKSIWRPQRHLSRRVSASDRKTAKEFVGRRFQYIRVGYGSHCIQLGDDGYVTSGYSPTEFYWWCKGNAIVLAGADGYVTAELRPNNGNRSCYGGRSERRQQVMLQLLSIDNEA